MLLQNSDISSRIYEEIVEEITREEEDLITRACAAAEAEAKMYLSRYDLTALFGTADEEPTFNAPELKNMVIDMACWHLCKIGHPSVRYDHNRSCYEDAVKTLRLIQDGRANPLWPYRDTEGQTAPTGSAVAASYTKRRPNQY